MGLRIFGRMIGGYSLAIDDFFGILDILMREESIKYMNDSLSLQVTFRLL